MRRSCALTRMHRERAERGPQEIGRSRGGPSTKIHAVVDALGNRVRLALWPGQTHEMKLAHEVLLDIADAYVIGDSAYSAADLIAALEARGCQAVIGNNRTHPTRSIDTHLYAERYLVEHYLQKIKRFRRIAMRYEKLARNFLAFLHIASVLVWLL